jgi:nicotinamidase-related amidase
VGGDCGVYDEFGYEATASRAYELGYHVNVVWGAMTDREVRDYDCVVQRIFPRIGKYGMAKDLLDLLNAR